MNTNFDTMALTLALPLLGALLIGIVGRNWGKTNSAVTGSMTVGLSFLVVLGNILTFDGARSVDLWTWAEFKLNGTTTAINFGLYIDPLSLTLMSVVTGVGFLIHWFSAEYMRDDEEYTRFFCLLNVFIASMTLLVLTNNFATLIIGWGAVGFASFALIGFWREKPSAGAAAKKAYVMNVIGDIGLMVSVFILFQKVQILDYATLLSDGASIIANDPDLGTWLPIFLVGLLIGAYAKSAQLPLHTWLPDAMEGPTPVSALIHAATMVTAGVYLVVRCGPLFELAPGLTFAIAVLGCATALYAALCALVQTDLKRVLAYSTMSQLGYMFMAAGLGAYGPAIFHLVTHAFFKALLFLVAGIVIHAAHGEQDMRRLGGLSKQIPFTCLMFGVGGAALAGVPLTSGFFSKESILHAAHHHEAGNALFLVGAAVAVLTAFYTGRAFFLTFYGPARIEKPLLPGGPTTVSCAILTILALGSGFFYESLVRFLDPSLEVAAFQIDPGVTSAPAILLSITVMIAIGLSWSLYSQGEPDRLGRDTTLFSFMRNGFEFDTAYGGFSSGVAALGRLTSRSIDKLFTFLMPGLAGSAFSRIGKTLAETQTGQLRHYMLSIMISVVVLLFYALVLGGGQLL